MNILDKIKIMLGTSTPDTIAFGIIIKDSIKTMSETNTNIWNVKITTLPQYTDVVSKWSYKEKVHFLVYCIEEVNKLSRRNYYSTDKYTQERILYAYIDRIFIGKLHLDEEDIKELFQALSNTSITHIHTSFPAFIKQVQKQYIGGSLPDSVSDTLKKMKDFFQKHLNNIHHRAATRYLELLDNLFVSFEQQSGEIAYVSFPRSGVFTDHINTKIAQLPQNERPNWYKLILTLREGGTAKPSKRFLQAAKACVDQIGTDSFNAMVSNWLSFLHTEIKTYTNNYTPTLFRENEQILGNLNNETVRKFIWTCSCSNDKTVMSKVAQIAEASYSKVPGEGAIAVSLGNACLHMLSNIENPMGIRQLCYLKFRIKYGSGLTLIDNLLQEVAQKQGLTIHEIEEIAVNDFELQDGKIETQLGEYKSILEINSVGKSEMKWFRLDGKQQKAVPSSIKVEYAAELTSLKDTQKQLDQTIATQRDRLDRMMRSNRSWTMDNFNRYYIKHPLMRLLSERIIWDFKAEGVIQSAMFVNQQWVNQHHQVVAITAESSVSLWHPATKPIKEITEWRDFVSTNEIRQPFKQAFREVYLLTEAEINTRTYSNRMAAHILKQHQFNSLAKGRGWKYSLIHYNDGGGTQWAALTMPEHDLQVQYWINEVNTDDSWNGTGIGNYIATDQVRFVRLSDESLIDLIEVPPIALSEAMRDIDLFVGVANVGNDPTWTENGGLPAYRDYWSSYSFGDLSVVAKNRKEILAKLLPRLKISKVATIEGSFLIVKGTLRTYKIHIGSTNILMLPNDQYLCIVPDRSQKNHTEGVFLPFDGDLGLSIILSKAFLLAEDNLITDRTITSQITRR